MIVPKRKINSWKLALEHGDYAEIERVTGMKAQQVGRALRKGAMTEKTYHVLLDYFEAKAFYKKQKTEEKKLQQVEVE